VFTQGFRPFFLGAGAWAFFASALWMPVYLGWFTLPTAFAPAQWHAHEMIFGIVIASLAGFLLTAIPNWTGRLPLRGGALIALASLWLAGRLATLLASEIGPVAASVIDLAFLPVLLAVIVREIVAGRNWRNLPITIAVGLLFAANLLMHLEVLEMFETDGHGLRLAIATMIMLIGLVGGRVIPSFTRNWLAKRDAAHLPAAFGRFDGIVLALQLAALVGWIVAPEALWVGWALVGAGVMVAARLARWRGGDTLSEPLVWSLHLGFLWMPVGLCLLGLSSITPVVPVAAGLHALGAGAMGSMILAVMSRAILGHTGQDLTADAWTAAVYILAATATAIRIIAAFAPETQPESLWLGIVLWMAAFAIFTVRYGRLILAR
jgi:uncharacterized protein involved in response to NO